MTKIKKLKMQYKIVLGLLVVVAIVGVGLGVKAYVSNEAPKYVVEGNMVVNEAPAVIEPDEEMFGALSSPDITSRYLSVNGDIVFHITGELKDASTTIVSIENPFRKATSSASDVVFPNSTNSGIGSTGATSTVEFMRIDIGTAATSTFTVACGANSVNFGSAAYNILSSDSISTSSIGTLINNVSSTYNLGMGDNTSVAKIMLTPTFPYLTCVVTTSYEGAFTEATNTFDGKFTARITKQR